jgi:hypothetical protein
MPQALVCTWGFLLLFVCLFVLLRQSCYVSQAGLELEIVIGITDMHYSGLRMTFSIIIIIIIIIIMVLGFELRASTLRYYTSPFL